MDKSRHYLWMIAEALQRHDLLPAVSEELIQQACEKLQGAAVEGWISEAFCIVLDFFLQDESNRFVFLDVAPESDNTSTDCAQVLRKYAQATLGEWVPAFVSTAVVSDTPSARIEAIDFEWKGEVFHWTFTIAEQYTKTNWVRRFYEQLYQFFDEHLVGTFFECFPGTRTLAYYLPRQASSELEGILDEMLNNFEGFSAFVKDLNEPRLNK